MIQSLSSLLRTSVSKLVFSSFSVEKQIDTYTKENIYTTDFARKHHNIVYLKQCFPM